MGIDASELDKLDDIEKQVKFATALTLTNLVKQSQKQAIAEISDKFTVRGNWAQPANRYGVRVETANKENLSGVVKTAADWLIKHETGEDKQADGSIAVPTQNIRLNIADKITKAKRPRNISGAFTLVTRTGVKSLFKRLSNRALVPLYRLVSSARIEKQSTIVEPTVETVNKKLGETFSDALKKAFSTAKK